MDKQDKKPSPVRNLTCCCCGEVAPGRQWYNRDTGYGLCHKCAVWIEKRENAETMKSNYGVRGYHYDLEFQEVKS